MRQSRLESAIETVLQVATGFWISFLVWTLIVAPLYGIPYSGLQGLSITGIFTVSSLLRMYTIRRFFNNGYHKLAHQIATRLVGTKGPEGEGARD